MKRVILNVICAFVLMLIQSNVDAAFGLQLVCQFGVIAALLTGALSLPMVSSSISIFCLAILCDMFVSGPVGLYAFALMVTFGVARALLSRFRSERVFALMLWACLLCVLFDLIQTALYSVYYFNPKYWTLFVKLGWKDALATTIMTPVMLWSVLRLERLFSRRRTPGLS